MESQSDVEEAAQEVNLEAFLGEDSSSADREQRRGSNSSGSVAEAMNGNQEQGTVDDHGEEEGEEHEARGGGSYAANRRRALATLRAFLGGLADGSETLGTDQLALLRAIFGGIAEGNEAVQQLVNNGNEEALEGGQESDEDEDGSDDDTARVVRARRYRGVRAPQYGRHRHRRYFRRTAVFIRPDNTCVRANDIFREVLRACGSTPAPLPPPPDGLPLAPVKPRHIVRCLRDRRHFGIARSARCDNALLCRQQRLKSLPLRPADIPLPPSSSDEEEEEKSQGYQDLLDSKHAEVTKDGLSQQRQQQSQQHTGHKRSRRRAMVLPGRSHHHHPHSSCSHQWAGFSASTDRVHIAHRFVPDRQKTIVGHNSRIFCGAFNENGKLFMSATQDGLVSLYRGAPGSVVVKEEQTIHPQRQRRTFDTRDMTCNAIRPLKCIRAIDVGWAILDTAFSPDGRFIAYSSWSPYVNLCNTDAEYELHERLSFDPQEERRFCLFSISFSPDNRELLGGSNDHCFYVYDVERRERLFRIRAHRDDINAVAFADPNSQVFITGSDDTLCKVWDRRILRSGDCGDSAGSDTEADDYTANRELARPVGVFSGHEEGITFVHAKNDGRYFISNGKDQCVKLWDMRTMADPGSSPQGRIGGSHWDYRFAGAAPSSSSTRRDDDTSLMTYRGHSVRNTLIRCFFSPSANTGQRYIYTGSADGHVVIYDVLSGEVVARLYHGDSVVRDVAWHPQLPQIVSSSWDGSNVTWSMNAASARAFSGVDGQEIIDLPDDDSD